MPLTAKSQTARQPARACTGGAQSAWPGPSARRVDGGVRDPLDDWIREDAAALAGNYSIHQPGVACTRFGRQFLQVLQAALAAQVAGVVMTVSTLSAWSSFR